MRDGLKVEIWFKPTERAGEVLAVDEEPIEVCEHGWSTRAFKKDFPNGASVLKGLAVFLEEGSEWLDVFEEMHLCIRPAQQEVCDTTTNGGEC